MLKLHNLQKKSKGKNQYLYVGIKRKNSKTKISVAGAIIFEKKVFSFLHDTTVIL